MSSPVFEMHLRVPLDRFELVGEATSHCRVLGVFGPSGAGKTTLLEALAGLRTEASGRLCCAGEVWLDSRARCRVPASARGVGYVPQDLLLFPHRDVRANLAFGAERARRQDRDFDGTWREVIATLELEPLLGRRVDSLSGGERQRVALGRALCSGPRLLLLDEPLASLDQPLRHRILPFLLKVRDRFAVPMLVVSHNPVELLALCEEVIALRAGRVVAQGKPTAVLTRPELYAAAASEGFENILPARVRTQAPHATVLTLGGTGDGPDLTVHRFDAEPGHPVSVGLPANDILVATQPVAGISARNRLEATVTAVETIGHKVVLRVELVGLATPEVVVELTPDALTELALSPGRRVWLLLKSSSIAVYR